MSVHFEWNRVLPLFVGYLSDTPISINVRPSVVRTGCVLQEAFPEWDLPSGEEGGGKPTCANSKAAKDLGLTLTPLRETFLDMARTLVQLGIATPKSR